GDIERAVDIELEIWAPVPTDPDAERRCRAIAHQNTFELTMDESWPRHIDPPAVGRLGEIRVPTLMIVGDRDQPLMLAIADALVHARARPGGRAAVRGRFARRRAGDSLLFRHPRTGRMLAHVAGLVMRPVDVLDVDRRGDRRARDHRRRRARLPPAGPAVRPG